MLRLEYLNINNKVILLYIKEMIGLMRRFLEVAAIIFFVLIAGCDRSYLKDDPSISKKSIEDKDNGQQKFIEKWNPLKIFFAPNKKCNHLTKVGNLEDLMEQLFKGSTLDCLLVHDNDVLEKMWGVKIFQIDDDKYVAGEQPEEIRSVEIQNALNKPYKNQNDAYILVASSNSFRLFHLRHPLLLDSPFC